MQLKFPFFPEDTKMISDVAGVCRSDGLVQYIVNGLPVHQTCFDYLDRCFDFYLEWDAKFVAGPMYSAVGKARLVSPQQRQIEWNRAVDNLRMRPLWKPQFTKSQRFNKFYSLDNQ